MKNILTYFVLLFTGLLLFSCDKPAPTELVDDLENDFEIEFLHFMEEKHAKTKFNRIGPDIPV